jgi:biotin synthase
MTSSELTRIRDAAESGQAITEDLALAVLQSSNADLPHVFSAASAVRHRFFGDTVLLCSILNARSGACSEDCAFCAQASCHNTQVELSPLLPEEEMLEAYTAAATLPITHFGIVTSGGALPPSGIGRICSVIEKKKIPPVNWCASLGCLEPDQLAALKKAGLKRFHHNLETAASFFPEICTTHSYERRLATVRGAKAAGLEVCCGGILGLGESFEQRVEFAFTLAREAVEAIPLNFLIPIPGTRLDRLEPMKPLDILRAVAMFRLTNPRAEVKVCAGRVHLRDLQSMIFHAGANSMMIGHLLTVAGQEPARDLQMLRDLEVAYAF